MIEFPIGNHLEMCLGREDSTFTSIFKKGMAMGEGARGEKHMIRVETRLRRRRRSRFQIHREEFSIRKNNEDSKFKFR